MTVPRTIKLFDGRTSFGGDHSAVLCVDTHDRLAFIGKAVRIYTNGFVNHKTLAFGVTESMCFGVLGSTSPVEKQCKGIYKKRLPRERKPLNK